MKQSSPIVALILMLVLSAAPIFSVAAKERRLSSSSLHTKTTPAARPTRRASPRRVQLPQAVEGQSLTVLTDGRVLLVGGLGQDGGPSTTVIINNPRTGENRTLPELRTPRVWHTATMLPDGRVFIFGGEGPNGRALNSAVLLDPTTSAIDDVKSNLTARSHHTATLLTDGRVLIAGGVSNRGQVVAQAQLWDYQTGKAETTAAISIPRQNHRAVLLTDGNVLIEGGTDENNNEVKTAELFTVAGSTFNVTSISADQDDTQIASLADSTPVDRASDVPVNSRVALRFSKRLPVEAIRKGMIKFETANEGVATKIVAAENGRLAFVTPLEPLREGATYTVTVNNSLDGSVSFATASISFTTVAGKNNWPDQALSDNDWNPGPENLRGDWRTKFEKSPWQDQPPLQAKPGETAISGQALTLKGQPLANVTISVKGESVRTDSSGRFLLRSAEGRQVMLVDGRSASRIGAAYGTFKVGVKVETGITNVLPYTIWMPKLDMAHAVNIPSPTKTDTVITSPLIPGLELHLPAGTVIRDLEGRTVTQLSITPVPTDRPPFPLPFGINVPVFASIQPGGAVLIPPRARLIYPNFNNEAPGARISFWNYDAEAKGWYIYGQGTVTPNGKQIVPDPGVVIYEFSGIMISNGGNPPADGQEPGDNDKDGEPVDLSTGLFILDKTEFVLPDVLPIILRRYYRPGDSTSRAFGRGSNHTYEMFLWSNNNYHEVDLILPDGSRVHYDRISPGVGYSDAVYEHTSTPSMFYKSQIHWESTSWHLRLRNGTVLVFPENAPLNYIEDRYGNRITITRTAVILGDITQVSSSNGRWLKFSYGSGGRISQITDNVGRTVGYTYDASNRLWKVTDSNGEVTEYTYDTSHRMLTIKDGKGITFLTNTYDANGRVSTQTQADSSTFEFDYTLNGSGQVTQTVVTDPRGFVRRVTFNSDGYTLTDARAVGTAVEQEFSFDRQSGTNLILTATDPLDRETDYTYDSIGNVTSVTRLPGTADEVSTTFTYEPNYSRVLTRTDPLSHTTTYAYDGVGNVTSITDPLSHQSTYTYNSSGQLMTATNPLSQAFSFAYDGGDLVSITDPLSRTTTRTTDSVGRVVQVTDPLGRSTRYGYDNLNQLTGTTDALQGATSFTYDENGKLLSVTDARSNVTSFEYDDMDRMITRTDPLTHDDLYDYDENGNLIQITDREGQVTAYEYDGLNRLTEVTFDDSSTTTYTYDLANRLTEVVDSVSGTMTFEYDDLDRLTEETTPEGTVTYTYDDAGRRSSMTVTGQSAVNYTYDNADRLTQISKGTATVTIAYDNANRRSSVTLPNGVSVEYTYDAASQLTALTYKYGGSTIGDLTYTYDGARRRTAIGGSYARTGLPTAVGSATYNAANEQTAFGSLSLSYDLNGNLTGDGTNTFSWNARKQLSSISGGVSASFSYDGLGRRTSKTISSTTTSYLHDHLNVVQELSGSTPTANMITGGLDEIFTRTDSSSTVSFLADGIGSILGLTNSSGSVQTEYTYEPFGKSSTSGTANSNTSQFTGRENDGTGLYYYRARYYSPTLQRFLSQDPLGFGGGDANLYAYVRNSPLNLVDPLGLDPTWWQSFKAWFWGEAYPVTTTAAYSALPGGEFASAAEIAPEGAQTLINLEHRQQNFNQALQAASGQGWEPTEEQRKEEQRRQGQPQPQPDQGQPGQPVPGQPDPNDPSNPGSLPYDPNALPPGTPPPLAGRKC